MKKIVTIAGSDTSGGAGIQADLRTFAKYNLYGMTALTVIVTMNPSKSWAHEVYPIPVAQIEKQLDTIFNGIGVDAIKTGMLPTVEIIELVGKHLPKFYNKIPIVIDPVMVCKGDAPLFPENAAAILNSLVKYATITTANLFEAAQLAKMPAFKTMDDAKKAAEIIVSAGSKNVVIKGAGNLDNPESAGDLLFDGKLFTLLDSKKVNTEHTHGLGCTYASHVASMLCNGIDVVTACRVGKERIYKGLINNFAINQYVGTLSFESSFE